MNQIYALVSPGIVQQIKLELDNLINDPGYNADKGKKVGRFLQHEAQKHSVAIEMPNGRKIRKGRAFEIAAENLALAHTQFVEEYRGYLDEGIIKDTASIIYPSCNGEYRSGMGFCFSKGFGNLYPSNVSGEMQKFIREHNENLDGTLDKAVHAHFNIARIHPFKDGNGRLARIVQNGILHAKHLPPIIIRNEDRKEYMDLISAAGKEYKMNDGLIGEQQAAFFNYLGMNLWNSLREIRANLPKSTKMFRVR